MEPSWDEATEPGNPARASWPGVRTRQDVRKFAAEQKFTQNRKVPILVTLFQVGLEKKAKEFAEGGAEVYSKA